MSHLGISSSYPALSGSSRRHGSKKYESRDPAPTPNIETGSVPPQESKTTGDRDSSQAETESDQAEKGGDNRKEGDTDEEEVEEEVEEEDEEEDGDENHTAGQTQNRREGLLQQLSNSCREETRILAQENLVSVVYDNINPVFKASEQVLGRKDSQENGTCATAFPLFGASVDDLKVTDLLDSADKAPLLKKTDILLTSQENQDLQDRLVHTVLRILVSFGGLRFTRFRKDVDATLPITSDKIELHKTEIHPLPAFEIDESSTTGNAEVLDAVFTELRLDRTAEIFH